MTDKKICLWCGKRESEVERFFPGPAVGICNLCMDRISGAAADDDAGLAERVRVEIDLAVQESFKKMVKQLHFGPLQDKYQRLMRVKFKEEAGSPTFLEVFQEFKKGVEAEVAADDFQTRYDLAIAYHEMGLAEDAFREMLQALGGALRQKEFDKASEVISSLLYFHGDSLRAIQGIFRVMAEAGLEG